MLIIFAEICLKKLGNFCQVTTVSQGWTHLRIHLQLRKLNHLKKALKKDKIGLFQCFQNGVDKEMKPAENFVQTIMYSGKNKESIAETKS